MDQWIKRTKDDNITNVKIQEKARFIHQKLHYGESDFIGSKSWVARFKNRYSITRSCQDEDFEAQLSDNEMENVQVYKL